ncbi:MAG: two-component regulator propeller domain-containing protein [Dysgonamonadaceae bacterium]|jgi:signal transduction histidine kinase/ligand-binding sensor domain-containing protein/CheY-like chemotaxis protein|nr:two-component regulator propeller domain-containing protein [Dysgonamonadaceae bacterium]
MKRRLFIKTIILFLFLLITGLYGVIKADAPYYYYKQLGIKEGLSQSKVQCILNDYKGYLWIGTESGLNRYDGKDIKQYSHRKDVENTLPHNNIIFLEEDSLLNLWVGTTTGISIYDREKDNFEILLLNEKPVYITSSLPVEGGVLFSSPGVIYKYIYETGVLKTLYRSKNEFTTFWKMIRYDDETVLLNSRWHGIYSFDMKTSELSKIDSFTGDNYSTIYMDSHNHLWVGLYGEGLYCFENKKLLKHFTTANSPLNYDVIHDLAERDNHLWVATDGGGVNIISLVDYSFSFIQQNQNDALSIPLNTVFKLYLDPSNNMWTGTIRKGLIGIKNVYARSFQDVSFGNHYGLSNPTVNCLFQDKEGLVWIGTDGGGVNRFDPKIETFRHYPNNKQDKIVSIIEFSPQVLLFSSFNKGIYLLNKQTGEIQPFILIDQVNNDKICKSGFSVYLQRISEKEILFSANNIYVYNMSTGKFNIVAGMNKEYEKNSPLIITTKGDKTYLADLKNICVYNASDKSFKTIYKGEEVIYGSYMDQDGVFWIATEEGLRSFNPLTGKNRLINTQVFNKAVSVISDTKRRIWIGNQHNLQVYSPINQSFIDLDEVDGVLPNEFICQATLLSENGDVFFGGTTGITLVNSNIKFDADSECNVELLEVLLDGSPATVKKEKDKSLNTLRIPWYFTSLQLKVLLKENDIFRKNRFRFNLKGNNMHLLNTSDNEFNINHLPIGEYFITTSYFSRTGNWSSEQDLLHIIVTPPWWKTAGFKIVLILVIILLAGAFVYFLYQRNIAKQRQEILTLKNKMNEEKVNFVTNISHELRTPLTLIYAPLKRIVEHKTDESKIESQLNMIYNQSCQMKSIIDMLLDVRKLEEGKEILNIQMHKLNEWVRSVGNKFSIEFEAKGINLEYKLNNEIGEVSFDKNKCEFVLSNFLMNALKFSESETTITISTDFSENGEWTRVSVQDEGIGLESVDTESIFSSFYQGTHQKGGSGIGLSYAKSLINLHKGKIGAYNAPKRGSVFYYELPINMDINKKTVLKNEEPALIIESKEQDEIDYRFFEKFSIIIVEDTVELQVYLKNTLADYFKHVYIAKNGVDGLEQIKNHLPDIILSDVMMPRMNGFELCYQVKSNLDISHIPFILLTAYNDPKNMYTGYKTGADAFLSKPFDLDTLLLLIYNQIKQREQIRMRYQENSSLSSEEISFSCADEAFLLKFNAVIEENISNPKLDVAFLSANMNMSRSLLFNKVKAITGMGIVDYTNKQRIEKSIVLLSTTTLNISEISDMVGFSSPRYFSRVFKSMKGVSPSDYRKD